MATKSLFVKTVNNNLEDKSIDELVKELTDIYVNGLTLHEDQNDYIDLLFLLYLDAISKKIYDKRAEGDVRPLISLAEYTNSSAAGGYFDRVFEAASRLINRIINHPNWNIILKIDAHNSPSGPSRYSLVSKNHYTDKLDRTSKAYYLFFLYKKYCDELVASENNELTSDTVYTVHRDLSSRKTIRSITYQFDGHNFLRYYDGNISTEEEVVTIDFGERCYLDFLACVLDKDFTKRSRGSAYGFASYYSNNETQTVWDTPKSFSFFNLGVSGFESWGTLMIEAFSFLDENENDLGSAKSVNSFFFREDDGEDNSQLIKIKSIVSALKKIDDEFYDALNKERINKEAEKSAKAAIMSRNMSHNLGSHVMAYLKQHLNSVQDMIRDNVLSQIIMPTEIEMKDLEGWRKRIEETIKKNLDELKEQKRKNGIAEIELESREQVKEVALPFLVGLGKFISYLQERQDFIATIATSYAPYFSQVNFKDFIFDELNPDLRYERHSDRIGMKPDNILLGNIARSEGLARVTQPTQAKKEGMSDIVIQFKSFDGHIPHGNQVEDLDIMRRVNISLPGGVVGRQAIFSIVENIIRNAAKHGYWGNTSTNKPSLVLRFNQYSKDDIEKGISLSDNDAADENQLGLLSFLRKYYLHTQDIDDLFVFTITDNMQLESETGDKWERLKALNRALIEPYIDEQGVMVNANKGIKEMRISAAWMRGLEERDVPSPINSDGSYVDTICWDKNHAPILLARPSKDTSTQLCNLQYIFCLLRPKAVAIITQPHHIEMTIDNNRAIGRILSDHAFMILSKDDFIKAQDKSYDIILFNDLVSDHGYTQADYNEVRQVSHNRVFRLSDKRIDGSLIKAVLNGSEKDIAKLVESLYKTLADYQEGEMIYIDDEKTDNKYNIEKKGEYPRSLVQISHELPHVYPYMYRTHHETEIKFTGFMSNYDLSELDNNVYVEGITGNNSTDRLVRNDVIDTIWFYKHLHAMKTKVAIFDERIFSKVYRREEKELEQSYFEKLPERRIKEIMDAASSDYTSFDSDDFITIKEQTALLEYVHSHDIFLTDADYCGIQYDMKGVSVFTILRRYNDEKQADGLDIYGYFKYLTPDPDAGRNTYRSIIGRVGHINMNNNGELSIVLYNSIYHQAFHYISIHQGLLDKIYEHFGIKRQSEKKHLVTLELYKEFANKPTDYLLDTYKEKEGNVLVEKTGYFLPRLMVHSGRSKPSFVDMPQKQPFIQYSAIEHAALDCKYSLVELLDFARYEQE